MIVRIFITTLCFSVITLTSTFAQLLDGFVNPTIKVDIVHPPTLGLRVDKVIFNPAKENCSDQIIDELIGIFVTKNVEVIDRDNLQSILYEHDLNLSGYVDKSSAVSIGKILGPSAMITVKVLKCDSEAKKIFYEDVQKRDSETSEKYIEREYVAQRAFNLKVSIQITDLTTGKIFAARVLEYSPLIETRSIDKGRLDPPSEYEAQQIALDGLTIDVHNMFFTWIETRELYFMDSKKGGLKQAFQALEAKNIDLAFDLSKKNLEYCLKSNDIKDKTLSHAYYNMGMMHFIRNEYQKALEYFNEAEKIRPTLITKESIDQTKKAIELIEEIQRIDEEATVQIEKSNSETLQAQKGNRITNDDIISLTQKKIAPTIIIQKIRTSNCKFDTSTDALVKLTDAGVSEEVILVMMEKQ